MRLRPISSPAPSLVVGVVGLITILAGCTAPAATASPSAAAPTIAQTAVTEQCNPIDLRLPSGDEVDLTGSWQGDDLAPYEMRQFGDCLWWVGNNPVFTYTGFVHLKPDFTLAGEWATIAASDVTTPNNQSRAAQWIGAGTIQLELVLSDEGTNATLKLHKVAFTNAPGFEPGEDIHVGSWTRVDDTPDHPIPAP
jgi:hypothetical protein